MTCTALLALGTELQPTHIQLLYLIHRILHRLDHARGGGDVANASVTDTELTL